MMEIQKTKHYEIFKKHPQNPRFVQSNVDKLILSIECDNMLHRSPMLVDSEMRVLDGWHRLQAAKFLQVEIFYQVKEDASPRDIILLNTQRPWGVQDYVDHYISLGFPEYIKLDNFCKQMGVSISYMSQFSRNKVSNLTDYIRSGTYKFFTPEAINQVKSKLENIKKIKETMNSLILGDNKFIYSLKLDRALISLVSKPEFEVDRLMNNMSYKFECLHPCSNTMGYYLMMREIYNWRNKKPIS